MAQAVTVVQLKPAEPAVHLQRLAKRDYLVVLVVQVGRVVTVVLGPAVVPVPPVPPVVKY